MRIGGHVSAAGGILQTITRAQAIGANCGQLFFTGPTAWRSTTLPDGIGQSFRSKAAISDIEPWFAHAIYLINLASADDRIWQHSLESLTLYRRLGYEAGLAGIILHTGSHGGAGLAEVIDRVVEGLSAVLNTAPEGSPLLLEVCAGQGGTIGAQFEELGTILRAMGNDHRLGICLDTCHVFAAGYDVRSTDAVASMADQFECAIGLSRLAAIHANDSHFALGSHRDRHANIGEGHIGTAGFAALLAHPALRQVPWLLETPGTHGSGPDLENINRLRSLAGLPELTALAQAHD